VCLITDAWEGIETFLTPEREVLVAHDADDVVRHLRSLDHKRAKEIGEAAMKRVLAEHTYEHRALQLQSLLDKHDLLCATSVSSVSLWCPETTITTETQRTQRLHRGSEFNE